MHRRHFSFGDASLLDEVAHEGVGRVRTARVLTASDGSNYRFVDLTEIPPGNSVGIHRHDHGDEEVYVIISGHGRMRVENDEVDVEPGDVIVNPPGGTHGLANTGSEPLRMVVLDVETRAR
jgi:mannose-6-phosphate isomerase-like protein (cupin superfamily)